MVSSTHTVTRALSATRDVISRRTSTAKEFACVLLGYSLACAAFFARVLFGSDRAIPWDFLDLSYPHYYFVTQWLNQGVLPLWDPHVGFGVPLIGMGGQLLYFPTYVQALFGHPQNIKVPEALLIAHVALAGAGMYYLCRSFGLHPVACFGAGLMFAFGGFFPNKMQHPGWVHTAAWFPLAALAFHRFTQTKRLRYVGYLTLTLFLMLLAGFWQQVMYSMYFLLFWAFWRAGTYLKRGGGGLRWPIALPVAVGAACALALLCDAFEFWPAFEIASQCVRQKLTLSDSAEGSMGILNLLTIVAPGVFAGDTGDALLLKLGDPSLLYSYSGTIALCLLAYSLLLWCKKRLCPDVSFFWAALALSISLAIGSATPVYSIAFRFLPGFAFFRRPLAFYFFTVFCAAILVAFAIDHLLRAKQGIEACWVQRAAIGIAVGGFAVAFGCEAIKAGLPVLPLTQPLLSTISGIAMVIGRCAFLSAAVLAFVALVFWRIGAGSKRQFFYVCLLIFVLFIDIWYFNSGRIFDGAKFTTATLATPRTLYGDPLPGDGLMASKASDPYRTGIAGYGGMFDSAGHIVGYENPGGYILFRKKRYIEYMSAVSGPTSPLLSLANVRYVLTSPPFLGAPPKTTVLDPITNRVALPPGPVPDDQFTLVDSTVSNWYRLFLNKAALPRYYFSSRVEVIPDRERRLKRLNSTDFVQSRSTVLESAPGSQIEDCRAGSARVTDYTPNRIRLQVQAPGNCLLVATDSYDPDWKAYVDGKPVPVMIANHVFRGLIVERGGHAIEMRYQPSPFYRGLVLSGASAITTFLLFLFFERRLEQWMSIASGRSGHSPCFNSDRWHETRS